MTWTVVTPAQLAVSVAEAKANTRIDHQEDDALVEGFIRAAMAFAERYLSRPVGGQTLEIALDGYPESEIQIPAPFESIVSVSYLDADGIMRVVSPDRYVADPAGWVVPTEAWPATMARINAVTVRFVTPSAVPDDIRQALLLLVGHFYENRAASSSEPMKSIPLGVEMLLGLNRRMFV